MTLEKAFEAYTTKKEELEQSSEQLDRAIANAVDNQERSQRSIAKQFGLSPPTVYARLLKGRLLLQGEN